MAILARKIAAGIYGRLEFDFACNRGHGFGEYHLHGVLNELLASNVDPRATDIRAGHAVEALQSPSSAGRKREVDFAVMSRDPESVTHVIEAKWAGSSHCTEKNVLTDLCRLALVQETSPSTTCLFVLAGGKDRVLALLNRGLFAPMPETGKRLIRYPYSDASSAFRLENALSDSHRDHLTAKLPKTPDRIKSLLYKPSHDDTPDWKVLVWRIWS